MAGKPGGLEINVIWTTFDLVSLLPPGLHDQTGAGHGLRLGSNQRISPLLPHDLCHLLRRPGEPSVRVELCQARWNHLDMRRWPRERKSDNPFLVFCFILPELPLKKNSYHQKVHERHSAALHSLCCNNGSRSLAEGKLIGGA